MNEKDLDTRIYAALEDLPLTPLPEGFVPGVMAQVRRSRRLSPRFDFRRYVLPAFLLTFIVGLVMMGVWWITLVDLDYVANLQSYASAEMAAIPLAMLLIILASLILCVLFMYTGFLSYFYMTSESG